MNAIGIIAEHTAFDVYQFINIARFQLKYIVGYMITANIVIIFNLAKNFNRIND